MQAVGNRTTSLPTKAIVNGLAIFGALSAGVLLVVAVVFGSAALSGALHAGSAAVYAGDPLTAPSMIQFRISEHADAAAQTGTDPLTAPSMIQFRISEHAEAP